MWRAISIYGMLPLMARWAGVFAAKCCGAALVGNPPSANIPLLLSFLLIPHQSVGTFSCSRCFSSALGDAASVGILPRINPRALPLPRLPAVAGIPVPFATLLGRLRCLQLALGLWEFFPIPGPPAMPPVDAASVGIPPRINPRPLPLPRLLAVASRASWPFAVSTAGVATVGIFSTTGRVRTLLGRWRHPQSMLHPWESLARFPSPGFPLSPVGIPVLFAALLGRLRCPQPALQSWETFPPLSGYPDHFRIRRLPPSPRLPPTRPPSLAIGLSLCSNIRSHHALPHARGVSFVPRRIVPVDRQRWTMTRWAPNSTRPSSPYTRRYLQTWYPACPTSPRRPSAFRNQPSKRGIRNNSYTTSEFTESRALAPFRTLQAEHLDKVLNNPYIVVLKGDLHSSALDNHFISLRAAHEEDPPVEGPDGINQVYNGHLKCMPVVSPTRSTYQGDARSCLRRTRFHCSCLRHLAISSMGTFLNLTLVA